MSGCHVVDVIENYGLSSIFVCVQVSDRFRVRVIHQLLSVVHEFSSQTVHINCIQIIVPLALSNSFHLILSPGLY